MLCVKTCRNPTLTKCAVVLHLLCVNILENTSCPNFFGEGKCHGHAWFTMNQGKVIGCPQKFKCYFLRLVVYISHIYVSSMYPHHCVGSCLRLQYCSLVLHPLLLNTPNSKPQMNKMNQGFIPGYSLNLLPEELVSWWLKAPKKMRPAQDC